MSIQKTFVAYRCIMCLSFSLYGAFIMSLMLFQFDSNMYITSKLDAIVTHQYDTVAMHYMHSTLLIFRVYLLLDIIMMCFIPILYRTDLLLHHVFTILMYSTFALSTPLNPLHIALGSILLTTEGISVFNYAFSDWKRCLSCWRILFILTVRVPLWVWTYNIKRHMYYTLSIVCLSCAIVYDLDVIRKSIRILNKESEIVQVIHKNKGIEGSSDKHEKDH